MFDPVLFAALMGSTALFSPSSLFSAGEQGAWYDPSDFSTMFQDSAGTTPVTAVEQPVGLILDKSGRNNHASQSTDASRPVLSARVNQLTYSEQFDNAAWLKEQCTVSANATTDPLGGSTADRITATAGTNARYVYQVGPTTSSGAAYALSFYAKAGTHNFVQVCTVNSFSNTAFVNFNIATGELGTTDTYSGSITATGGGWYRCTVSMTATAAASPTIIICSVASASAARAASWTAAGTETLFLWGADLRVTNDGVGIPAYQRVAAATDYDTTGYPFFLRFDGTDDSLATASVDFSATDKVTAWAGMRKLSDAAFGMVVELSESASAYRGFNLNTRNVPGYGFASQGSVFAEAIVSTGYTSPITNVITCLGNISEDTATIRANGSQVAQATTDQGTGNYGNFPLYIGRRGGTSLPYNGRLYSLIVRGAQSTDAQIASTEAWVDGKTGAY